MSRDYEVNHRLAECLREWQVALNNGGRPGSRLLAAAAVLADEATYITWLAGRAPSGSHERLIRHIMPL